MPAPCSPLNDAFTLATVPPTNATHVAGVDAPITFTSAVPLPLLQGVTLKAALAQPNATVPTVVGIMPQLASGNGSTTWGLIIPAAMLHLVGVGD